jgi:hypothetical protein
MNIFEVKVVMTNGYVELFQVTFPSGPVQITEEMIFSEAMFIAEKKGLDPEYAKLIFR